MLKYWYKTVYEKSILYGASVWATNLNNNEKKKLHSIQRPFLLKITRAYKTTSNLALNALAGLPPFHLEAEHQSKLVRLLQLNRKVTIKEKEYKPEDINTKETTNFLHPAQKTGKNILTKETQKQKTTKMPIPKDGLYTDGSKTNDGVGAAWVRLKSESAQASWSATLQKHNTIFQAEALALKAAIQEAIQFNEFPIKIYSDSNSVLESLKNHKERNKEIQEIQILMNNLIKEEKLQLSWIPAHTNILGNELADQLAKRATLKPPNTQLKMPISLIKRLAREERDDLWQTTWREAGVGRLTFELIDKVR